MTVQLDSACTVPITSTLADVTLTRSLASWPWITLVHRLSNCIQLTCNWITLLIVSRTNVPPNQTNICTQNDDDFCGQRPVPPESMSFTPFVGAFFQCLSSILWPQAIFSGKTRSNRSNFKCEAPMFCVTQYDIPEKNTLNYSERSFLISGNTKYHSDCCQCHRLLKQ